MKPTRLALATILTWTLGLPALAVAQPTPPTPPTPAPDAPARDATTVAPGGPAVDEQPAPPPAPPPAPADPHGAKLEYDKGFTLESTDGAFELKAGLRSEFRFEVVRAGVTDAAINSRFSVPRLRLQLEGHAYGEANGYKVELDMANKGFALLKDFFVDHAFSKGLHLRAGQWKRPFHRQELVSDFGSEFLERSLVNDFAGAGRGLGVALHNDYEKSPDGVEWALGVFSDTGDKPTIKTTCTAGALPTDPPTCTTGLPGNVPIDFGPALVAHVGWNSGGIKGYSEGDLEGGPLRYAIAASYRLDPRDLAQDANGKSLMQHAISLDTMIKVAGLGLSGALVLIKDPKLAPATGNDPGDLKLGFYGQASYLLMPKKLLGAIRFARVPDDKAPDEKKYEILGGVDWFWHGHNAKLMLDAGVIHTTGASATNDLQLRTQLQLVL